jgi:DNA repair protein RadC
MNPPHEFKVMRVRECIAPAEMIDTPDRAAEYWRTNIPTADWFDPCKEAFIVLILNTRRHILGHNLVAIGSLDSVTVMPREVFAPILAMAGHAAILMHNHPSGDPTPSEADIKVSRDLIRAGQLLRIEILDHVIVGQDQHASLRALGYFYS